MFRSSFATTSLRAAALTTWLAAFGLLQAGSALAADNFYRKAFGDVIVDYLLQMKRAELARYESAIAQNPPPEGQEISEWEMREYFEFY